VRAPQREKGTVIGETIGDECWARLLVGSAAAFLFTWASPVAGVYVPFTKHVVSATAVTAYSVFALDVDGRGNTDVLSASYNDDEIAW
jgi:hypothetical protein